MRVNWNGESYEVRQFTTAPGNIKVDDFLLYRNDVWRVITVQHNVPRIENLSHKFHMITLQNRDGRILPADDIVNPREIARPVKKFRSVPERLAS